MWPFGSDSGSRGSTTAIAYTHVTNKRSRKLTVKVTKTGEVQVVTPPYTPQWMITQFVEKHREWITRARQRIPQRKDTGHSAYLFGKRYTKQVRFLSDKPLTVMIVDHTLIANCPEAVIAPVTWGTKHERQLHRFLKQTAQTYITTRTTQLAKQMGIAYGKITLREQKTRWGSCSSSGNLNFNWRLVHAPPAVIDYVIIHELAHRVHMNHSRQFWELVALHDQAYRIHQGWLKRMQHTIY